MISEEEIYEMYAEMAKLEEEQEKKWNEAKNELKNLIHPKYFDFAEDHETFFSEGIVEIELTEKKKSGYPNHQCCKVKGEFYPLYMFCESTLETLNDDSKYEEEEIEYWVYQTVGYLEDDYSGFLLLPMLDGRYWKISYSC